MECLACAAQCHGRLMRQGPHTANGSRGAHRNVAPFERRIDGALVVQALRKGCKPVHCAGAVLPQVLLSLILHTLSEISTDQGWRRRCSTEQHYRAQPLCMWAGMLQRAGLAMLTNGPDARQQQACMELLRPREGRPRLW